MFDATSLVLANVASTLFLAGVIWFVQIVHYPLFSSVGPTQFVRYENQHADRTTWVVAPAMLVEAVTAALLIWVRPPTLSLGTAFAGVLLVGVIWISTFVLQVPLHARLADGFEPRAYRRLVSTNWIRTAAWTARALLALTMVLQLGAPELTAGIDEF